MLVLLEVVPVLVPVQLLVPMQLLVDHCEKMPSQPEQRAQAVRYQAKV